MKTVVVKFTLEGTSYILNNHVYLTGLIEIIYNIIILYYYVII